MKAAATHRKQSEVLNAKQISAIGKSLLAQYLKIMGPIKNWTHDEKMDFVTDLNSDIEFFEERSNENMAGRIKVDGVWISNF